MGQEGPNKANGKNGIVFLDLLSARRRPCYARLPLLGRLKSGDTRQGLALEPFQEGPACA